MKFTLGSLFLANAATLSGAERRLRECEACRLYFKERASRKIGICDWDVRATGRPTSFATAKELGFDGVQVSYQIEGEDALSDKANRPKFVAAAKESGSAIASLCMGFLNSQPLATSPEGVAWVEDCISAMVDLNVCNVLIPFFGNADMSRNPEHVPLVIEKFKQLAPIAERNRKTLSIESTLSAEEHLRIIEAVGSDAVKVYYDVANPLIYKKGYDIFHEMELLGKRNLISEIHFKENRNRLGDGDVNFPKVRETIEKIGYQGWIIVEGSTSGDWRESQIANVQFVRRLFEQ